MWSCCSGRPSRKTESSLDVPNDANPGRDHELSVTTHDVQGSLTKSSNIVAEDDQRDIAISASPGEHSAQGQSRIETSLAEHGDSRYTYDALDEGCIRVFVLQPGPYEAPISIEIQTISLATPEEPYQALSYTWGDHSSLKKVFTSNGGHISITPNLYDALSHLRLYYAGRRMVIWADQICIDQSNIQEREEQVKLMGKIYFSAFHVAIWLSKRMATDKQVGVHLDYFFDFIRSHPNDMQKGNRENEFTGIVDSIPVDVWDTVAWVLSHSYFERAWIVQEIVNSNEAVVLCAGAHRYWYVLQNIANYVEICYVPRGRLPSTLRPLTGCLFEIYMMWGRLNRKPQHSQDDPKWTLSDLCFKTWDFKSTDPRDKVYSVAGLLDNTDQCVYQELRPDYSISLRDLYHLVFAPSVTHQRDLKVLDYCSPRLTEDWPSWHPNPRLRLGNFSKLQTAETGFQAAASTEPDVVDHGAPDRSLSFKVRYLGRLAFVSTLEMGPTYDLDHEGNDFSADDDFDYHPMMWDVLTYTANPHTKMLSPEEKDHLHSTFFCGLWPTDGTRFANATNDEKRVASETFSKEPDMEKVGEQITRIFKNITNLRFCRIEAAHNPTTVHIGQGTIGWVPRGAEIGDHLYIVHGYPMPMLTRPVKTMIGSQGPLVRRYKFMGASYVNRMMDGEAMATEGLYDEFMSVV